MLITHQLVNACTSWLQIEQVAWSTPEHSQGQYDFGSIEYCYLSLNPLASHVPEPTVEDYSLSGKKTKILEQEIVIEAPIDLVFSVISDVSIRHEWMVGLSDSDRLNSKITRNGSTHRCVIKGDDSDPFQVSHSFQVQKDFITFTDTNHKDGIDTVFTLRRIGNQVTRLQAHYFMKRHALKELIFNLFMKKKTTLVVSASCENLKAYCKALIQAGKEPAAQILLEPAGVASLPAS